MEPINRKIWDFQVLQSKFVKSLMSVLKRKIDSSPNFLSLFSFMKDNSSVLFSLNNIYFAQKELLQVNIFWIFECPGQNLSNFIHQFWNDSWFLTKFCNPSSVSWKITPLYFFISNSIYILCSRRAH